MTASADDNLDVEVRRMWNEHLSTLSPDVAATKRWRSGYWVNWFTALNLSNYPEFAVAVTFLWLSLRMTSSLFQLDCGKGRE